MANPKDTANEPVDHLNDDGDFMDTGVLHEKKCGNTECHLPHPHPEVSER